MLNTLQVIEDLFNNEEELIKSYIEYLYIFDNQSDKQNIIYNVLMKPEYRYILVSCLEFLQEKYKSPECKSELKNYSRRIIFF